MAPFRNSKLNFDKDPTELNLGEITIPTKEVLIKNTFMMNSIFDSFFVGNYISLKLEFGRSYQAQEGDYLSIY